LRKTFVTAVLAAVITSSAQAGFFSNVQGDPRSQEASATALDGIGHLFQGIAALERADSEGSRKTLEAARNLIDKATVEFDELSRGEIAAIPVDASNVTPRVKELFEAIQQVEPGRIGDVFSATAQALRNVSDSLERFAETPDLSTYSELRREIALALTLGEFGTRLTADALEQ
jgi:hypothetical protein